MTTLFCPGCFSRLTYEETARKRKIRCGKCLMLILLESTEPKILRPPVRCLTYRQPAPAMDPYDNREEFVASQSYSVSVYDEHAQTRKQRNGLMFLSMLIPFTLVAAITLFAFSHKTNNQVVEKGPPVPGRASLVPSFPPRSLDTLGNVASVPERRPPAPDQTQKAGPAEIAGVRIADRNQVQKASEKSPQIARTAGSLEDIEKAAEQKKRQFNEHFETLIKSLKSPRLDNKIAAARELEKLGKTAQEASKPLCEAMIDSRKALQNAASKALEVVNPELHEIAQTLAFDNTDPKLLDALEKAEQLGEAAGPAFPLVLHLRERMSKKQGRNAAQTELAIQIMYTTAAIAPHDETASEMLVRYLKATSVSQEVRCAAIEMLPKMDARVRHVTTLAETLQRNTPHQVKLAAIKAIGEIGAEAQAARESLEKCYADPDEEIRIAASEAMKRVSEQ